MPRLLFRRLAVFAGGVLAVTGCCCIDHACQVGDSGHAQCSTCSPGAGPMHVGPEMVLSDGAAPPASPQLLAPPLVMSRFHPVPTRPVFAPR